MGRKNKKWNRKRKKEEAKNKAAASNKVDDNRDNRNEPWEHALQVSRNGKMETFYALQRLHNQRMVVSNDDNDTVTFVECTNNEEKEDERRRWLTSLQTMLPASFRIGTDVDSALRQRLEHELDCHFGDSTKMEIVVDDESDANDNDDNTDGMKPKASAPSSSASEPLSLSTKQTKTKTATTMIAPANRIPYIPHAYQLSVDRRTIRRTPEFQQFHQWLTTQTSCGNITRQETVSMIPPVVLDVQPHHYVLDMCAAPGSKTSQLLEMVSCNSINNNEDDDYFEPRGCVVANDSDPKRAYMLVHQLKRINSPAVLITSCDAQFFPLLVKSKQPRNSDDNDSNNDVNKASSSSALLSSSATGMFDRVLADVPCSGDGTTRKNPGIWRHWASTNSLSLHPLQLSIALNGARLLKVGGYLCYSTCAMNPIENEAVVAELLRASNGSLELVDPRPTMKGLIARPGWSTWRVLRETVSRKQVKDYRKKNNAKMQARRQAWQEQNGGVGDGDDNNAERESGIVELETTTLAAAEAEAATANHAEEMDANGNSETAAAREQGKGTIAESLNDCNGGPFPSWDEETLLARLASEGLKEFKSFDEVPDEWKKSVRKTCFPPTPEEAAEFHLERCLRCLPHDMDTGGFFVALLKKVAPMGAKAKQEAMELAQELRPDDVDGADEESSPVAKRMKTYNVADIDESEATEEAADTSTDANDVEMDAGATETVVETSVSSLHDAGDNGIKTTKKAADGKPSLRSRGKKGGEVSHDGFVPVDDDKWKPLVEFYGFSDSFPRDQYMARANSDAKTLYFVGAPIKSLMDLGIQERVTIINSGLKSFARNTKDCRVHYRIAQEGIHYLAPHMTKRRIVAEIGDFSKCIDTGSLRLEMFSDEFARSVREVEPGSFVVALKGYEKNPFKKLFLVMWRCRKDAIDCLVAKVEMEGMKSKLRAITGLEEATKAT